jgi:VCBS repeat-containing protein
MKALLFGKYIRRFTLSSSKGVATLEILIAFAILMLSMTAVILVVFGNQSISIDTQTNEEAVYKAKGLLETARALSRQDFSLVAPVAASTEGIYQKSVDVTSLSSDTKQVTSNITWTSGGRNLAVHFTTLLTNPTVGNACSATLSGDWTAPEMSPPYELGRDLLVPSDTSSGFPITSVATAGSKLFVTVNNTNGNNNGTFFGFDISNPASKPVFLFGVDNANGISEGLNSVAVNSHYAYVANAYTGSSATCTQAANCAQLQIFDTDNPTAASKNLKIPVTVTGNKLAYGTNVFYNKGYVYLGLAKASGSGNEFQVIDVGGGTGSPTNPIIKGTGYHVGNGVNAIFVKDNLAYIATPNTENLTIVDVDPTSATFLQRVGGSGTLAGSSNGESIYVKDGIIYLGRTFGTNEFYLLNSPSGSTNKFKDIGGGSGTSVNGILIREYLAFLITNAQFQIWNTNGSITQYATPLTLPGGSGTAIGCKGNYIYVGSLPSNDKGSISIVGPKSVYTLANSGDIAVQQGNSGSTNITKTLSAGLGSGTYTLSASGLPAGASAAFTNDSCTPTCTASVTIGTINPSTPTGTFPITVTGTGGVTTTFNLIVTPAFSYSLSAAAPSLSVNQGSSVSNTITVTKTAGSAQPVTLSVSGLQNNVTTTMAPISGSCTPNTSCTVVITFNAASNAQKKTNTITITGASPTQTTTFQLQVK